MYRRLCVALLLGCVFSCQSEGERFERPQAQILEASLFPTDLLPTGSETFSAGAEEKFAASLTPAVPVSEYSTPAPEARPGIFYNVIAANGQVVSQPANPASALMAVDEALYDIVRRYEVPGLSVAITRNGQPVFSRSYGYANKETGDLVSDQSLYRIASLSKPITSASILKLIQDGKITLADKVFGPEGILGEEFPRPVADPNIELITVYHLLTHTSGWTNSSGDPMLGDRNATAQEIISTQVLNSTLEHEPGSTFSYSNLGYSILGRVIEKVSGKSYPDFVQEEILRPAGIFGMRLAGDTQEQLAPKEVRYYQNEYSPYAYNMARMDSHGGWLATTDDLMRFMALIDRNTTVPDLINSNLLEATYFGTETWTHYGSLPGTTAVLTRLNDEYSFVVLANTRYNGSPNQIADELNDTLKSRILQMETWPEGERPAIRLLADKRR